MAKTVSALGAWLWVAAVVWAVVSVRSEYHFFTRVLPLSALLLGLGVWSARRLPRKLWAYGRVMARARRNRTDLLRYLIYRPAILGAVAAYESAVLAGSQTDTRLKALACLKTSSLIGCPF
jgi:hypothetical protein